MPKTTPRVAPFGRPTEKLRTCVPARRLTQRTRRSRSLKIIMQRSSMLHIAARPHFEKQLSADACARNENTKLLSRLDAAIEFHFAILMAWSSLWQRFQRYLVEYRQLGFSLDISRMKFPDDLFERMRSQIEHAFAAMRELEAGAIANLTEKRMGGHYW